MSQFIEQPELFDKVILLSGEEVKAPEQVISKFCGNYHLHECRHILWTMVETCLSTDHVNFCEAEDRADLLTRARHIEELMEAAYLLFRKRESEKSKKDDKSGEEPEKEAENSGAEK